MMYYLRNKRTKEMFRYSPEYGVIDHTGKATTLSSDRWELIKADENGWITWDGKTNECPVPGRSKVGVILRSGDVIMSPSCAETFEWIHENRWKRTSDIIAYRPILECKVEDKMKLNKDGYPEVGTHCLCDGLEVWICGYSPNKVWLFNHDEGDIIRVVTGCEFVPIKTKRDELLEEMISDGGVYGDPMVKAVCESLLDAGYHK